MEPFEKGDHGKQESGVPYGHDQISPQRTIIKMDGRSSAEGRTAEDGRLYWYDNMRAILMVLVVIGHFVDKNTKDSGVYRSIYLCIYAFHMPLLLFIAGVFHKKGGTARKIVSDLTLGVALQILQLSSRIFWGQAEPTWSFLSKVGIAWFLYALAGYELIMWAVGGLDRKKLLICSAVFACFVGYDPSIGDTLVLSRLFVFLPFYLAGTMISPEGLRKMVKRRKAAVFIGVAVLFVWGLACLRIPALYSLRRLFTGRNPFSKGFLPYGCFYRLVCMTITSVLSLAFLCAVPDRRIPIVSISGRRTRQTYFYHYTIREILWHYGLGPLLMGSPGGKLLWIFIAAATALVTSTKLFSYPTKWLRF